MPPHPDNPPVSAAFQEATLAGGCFWCIEAGLERLLGVAAVVSGYTGGHQADPDYDSVCSGDSGHAEAVRITFDPAIIPYRDLLEVFFALHDPTTPNRQGADVGSQYRSAIFFHSPQQDAVARAVVDDLLRQRVFAGPIVTRIEPAGRFYAAEACHQNYFRNHPDQPYCQRVVAPKLARLREKFISRLKPGTR